MEWADFADKKVALLGAGKENVSLIPWLIEAGAAVTVCDQWASELPDSVRQQIGADYLENLGQFDYVFRSPGLPIARVDAALKNQENQPIRTSAMDLFLGLGLGKVVGVTGTKGKGTTATMLGSILEAAGRDVIVAGNIGAVIFDALDEIKPETIVILELSSFQLEDVRHSPEIAVLLPVMPEDHLQPLSERSPNFHPNFEAYAGAKANITAFQTTTDWLVYAADSPAASDIAGRSAARRIGVGERLGDIVAHPDGRVTSGHHELMNLHELNLRGRHIFLDATLALTAARELGADAAAIRHGLLTFEPLPHRLQTVGTVEGVTFVDDSYATAPSAAIAAIEAFDAPIIWIGGGSRKGADFRQLAETIAHSRVQAIVLLGEEAERIELALRQFPTNQPVLRANSISEAVRLAKSHAQPGDVVLLSPACASKDMFRDAAERGELFQREVQFAER